MCRGDPQRTAAGRSGKTHAVGPLRTQQGQAGLPCGHHNRNPTTTSGHVTLHIPGLKSISFETTIIDRYRLVNAINKAKKLLTKNGVLIIVGLAKPSSLSDWLVELARIIPSKIISAIKKNTTSEELNIDVSYDFPTMKEVRQILNKKLCGYTLRYGLHYRYLLTWENN